MKNIHDDLSSLDLGIYEARDLVQNRPSNAFYCWIGNTVLCVNCILLNVVKMPVTHTHPFNGPLSGTNQVSWYHKGNGCMYVFSTELRDRFGRTSS